MEGATAKIDGLRHYNEKLDLWLATIQNAPPEQLLGVDEKERETIRDLKFKTSELQEKLINLQKQIDVKEVEVVEVTKKASQAKYAVDTYMAPLEEVLELVLAEEEAARKKVVLGGHVEDLKRFLKTQQQLQQNEKMLLENLKAKEDALQQARDSLCRLDLNQIPLEDKGRVKLYIQWKEALAEKNRNERVIREKKYLSKQQGSIRQQVHLVIAEMERSAEIKRMEERSAGHEKEISETKERIENIQESMHQATESMKQFRREFEQLRVAIMVDKSIKCTQYAALDQHRKRLEQAEGWYDDLVDIEKERIRRDENEKWEERLTHAQEKMARQLGEEREEMYNKLKSVKGQLAQKYFEAFKPMLEDADSKLDKEKTVCDQMRSEIDDKQREIERCEREIQELTDLDDKESAVGVDGGREGQSQELKLAQRELEQLWDELDVDAEEKVAFYSELDLVCPYNQRVYDMYEEVLGELESARTSTS